MVGKLEIEKWRPRRQHGRPLFDGVPSVSHGRSTGVRYGAGSLGRQDMKESFRCYAGQTVSLASMHRKEEAIEPPLREVLGLSVVPVPGLDTDQFGTFGGEIPRRGTVLEAAVKKARLGMSIAGSSLGLASEGSFGPHPALPFLPAGIEVLVFIDDERGMVVREHAVFGETNFAHLIVSPADDPGRFLDRIGFPSHAVIVRPNAGGSAGEIVKGISQRELLERSIFDAAKNSLDMKARIETDMRAQFNPTRMKSLRVLAGRLAARLATHCPVCASPGFGFVSSRPGLRCEDCRAPTEMAVKEIHACPACHHQEERARADGRKAAPASACTYCNP